MLKAKATCGGGKKTWNREMGEQGMKIGFTLADVHG